MAFTQEFVRTADVDGLLDMAFIVQPPYLDSRRMPVNVGNQVDFLGPPQAAGAGQEELRGRITELAHRQGVATATVEVNGVSYIGPVNQVTKVLPPAAVPTMDGAGRKRKQRNRKSRKQKQRRQRTRRQRN